MKFYMTPAFDKHDIWKHTLKKMGYGEVSDWKKADFALLDHNWIDALRDPSPIFRSEMPIFMVPHGARCYMFWDAVYDIIAGVDMFFAPSDGINDLLTNGGWDIPTLVTGFPWAPVRDFREGKKLCKILFAPIHPDPEGKYTHSQRWYRFNQRAWDFLRDIKDKYNLTVYHSWTPEDNGLTTENNVLYIQSDLSIKMAIYIMQQYDLVIAQETFANIAIAQGIPTIMIDDTVLPPGMPEKESAFWPYYTPYPLNLLSVNDPEQLCMEAMHFDYRVEDWKTKYIGKNFNPIIFSDGIEQILTEKGLL